jgi:DNA-binding transcriptional LysR family regulator
VTEFSSVEAIKQCVIGGMGIGLLPAIVVEREIRHRQITSLHWVGPTLDIVTRMLWHKDKWVSPAMLAFQEMMQATLEEAESVASALALEGLLVG